MSIKDLTYLLPKKHLFKVADAKPELVDWGRLCSRFKLPESFIERHKYDVDWEYISMHQKLSEEFIEKYGDYVNWELIFKHQKVSKELREKYNIY